MPARAGRLTYLTLRGGSALAGAVPYRVGAGIARLGGRIAMRVLPDRRAMAARHQARAGATDIDAAVRGAFDSYARYWLDLLRLPADMRRNQIVPYIESEGYGHVEHALAQGRGVIVALPHVGGWETAGAWMCSLGHDIVAVAEPLEPVELFEWFERQRREMGVEIVALGPDASNRVMRALRENSIVCLLSDRDITGDGVEVEFFGERTTLPGGPATAALRTGAALICAAPYFGRGREFRMVMRPPLPVERQGRLREDIVRITQLMACEFEGLIKQAPEQWHLMQPNWPSDKLAASRGGAVEQ